MGFSTAEYGLKRFFAQFDLPLDDIARLAVHWMAPEGRWILCLDRTNWEFGQFKINILMVAIAYRGTAIPVVWTLLPKTVDLREGQRRPGL